MLPDRFTIEQIREREARGKSAFYAGETDTHPQGRSGMKWVTPPEDDRRCLDARMAGEVIACGEWHNLAGHDYQHERWHTWVFRSRRRKDAA